MACQKKYVEKQIIDLYEQISKLDSLKPSTNVDSLFGQLMSTCLSIDTNIDVQELSQEVQNIRSSLIKQWGEAEECLEEHFATILTTFEGNPLNHLYLYPKYNIFLKLNKLEYDLVIKYTSYVPTKVAFVGSGPMPISSIFLAKFHLQNTIFHNFDIDSKANLLADSLVSRDPDLSKRMTFYTTDILDVTKSLRDYDVVFLAALVGVDKKTKIKVIEHLEKHMAPGALLVLRSARGLRAFLYQIVDPCDLKGFEVLTVYHPTDKAAISSVLVARKLGLGGQSKKLL